MFRGLSPILAIRGMTPAVLVVAGLMVGACGDTRKVLGYDKVTPDEFKVVSRAPLSLPPDYGLRPPQPGAPRPQEGTIWILDPRPLESGPADHGWRNSSTRSAPDA